MCLETVEGEERILPDDIKHNLRYPNSLLNESSLLALQSGSSHHVILKSREGKRLLPSNLGQKFYNLLQ